MGQAKNRGTREQRVAQAQIRENAKKLAKNLLYARSRRIAASVGFPLLTIDAAPAQAIDSIGSAESDEVAHG